MKRFRVIPKFSFVIEADDYDSAERIAGDKVSEMCPLVCADYELYLDDEDNKDEVY